MSDFERQVQAERALAEEQNAARLQQGIERARKQRQMYQEFVDLMLSQNITSGPYFERSEKNREREGLGKYLGGRTSYVITRSYTFTGRCWLFLIQERGNDYAMTTDARLIKVERHKLEQPSKYLKYKLDPEADELQQAGESLLVGGEETTISDQYLVTGARSLVDGKGPMFLEDLR